MKHCLYIPTLIALTSVSLIFTNPVQAQPQTAACSNDYQEQPDQDRREITNTEYGLRFEIPVNYRTELQRQGELQEGLSIFVRNPTDVDFLDCASRNRMVGAGHQVSDIVVRIKTRPSHVYGVGDIWQDVSESGGVDISDSDFMTIAGQDAILYTQQNSYPERYRYATFIHPNGRDLVSIYTGDYGNTIDPIDLEVMDMVINSLTIEN